MSVIKYKHTQHDIEWKLSIKGCTDFTPFSGTNIITAKRLASLSLSKGRIELFMDVPEGEI